MQSIKYTIYLSLIYLILLACNNKKEPIQLSSPNSENYTEPHRPQFHFSPKANWMNDPNGMVYHNGEYHLFYQYYPDSTVWGPMHWGHAISSDLLHWKHLPIALYPDSLGYIFSGSAVIDHNNTSGLGTDGKDPMIAIFTHHNMQGEKLGTNNFQYQSIAYSNDNGRTFHKYEQNPVISNPGIKDFRDPKVIWDEANEQWVMVFAAYDKAMFYVSKNLLSWTKVSEFGINGDDRLWECPDLFPLKVMHSDEIKWILITSIQKEGPNGGTATSYFVGNWDGTHFLADPKKQHWLDYGKDNYAFVTWSNLPKSDEPVIGIGWMSNWQYAQVVPTDKWRSAMTLPRTLKLKKINNTYKLYTYPIKGFDNLTNLKKKTNIELMNGSAEIIDNLSKSKIDYVINKPLSSSFHLQYYNDKGEKILVGYNHKSQQLYIDRTQAGKVNFNEQFSGIHTAPIEDQYAHIKLTVILDHSSIEVFANDGEIVLTDIFFSDPLDKVSLHSQGQVQLISCEIYSVKGIWD